MKKGALQPASVVGAAAAAIAAAVVTVAGLAWLSKPANFAVRVAAVERDADLAASLLRKRDGLTAFPRGSACPSASPAEAEKLRIQLAAVAAATRLNDPRIEVTPKAPVGAGDILTPIQVQFEASGPYDGALAALDHLSTLRPVLFVDTVDLTSRTSFVTLAVTGRVLCSALQ